MAKQYDGAVTLVTKLESRDLNSQMLRVVNQIKKTEKEIDSLNAKMAQLEKTNIPTEEYKSMQSELQKAEVYADKLYGKLRVMEKSGDTTSAGYRRLVEQIRIANQQIDNLRGGLSGLENAGKAFVPGNMTEEYQKAQKQVEKLNSSLEVSSKHLKEMYKKQMGVSKAFADIKKAATGISGVLRKINTAVNKVFSGIINQSKNTSKAINDARMSFVRMLAMSVAFSSVFRAISAISSGVGQGFTSLVAYSDSFAQSVQTLKNALATLGNSFAAAFAPIIQAAIPYLVELINWINRAISAIGQLFAYLTGKSTFLKATEVQAGYNDELEGTADAAKKAYGALAKFDDLDVLQKQDSSSGGGSGAGGASGGFEEVPIDDDIKGFGDKLKDIFSKIFAPLKEAWDREGQFVMDSWKYALDEVWKLVKDIGRDFLTVWNQEATIQMFADILHIIGDIGLIVGHLASNLRDAWNENNNGLRILENIRDIFAVIVYNIRQAADATVGWAENLNFRPILEAFAEFTGSLVPVVGTLTGIITDFYTQVLLPLGKWVIEGGLPQLLQILTDFNKKVNWAAIRQNLSDFWDKLEPFAETVGQGLIDFIKEVSDLVANFLNSETFENFLDHLAEWMDSVEPEDVTNAIKNLAGALITFKAALAVANGVVAVSKLVKFLKDLKGIGVVTAGITLVMTGFEAIKQWKEDIAYIKENGFFNWQENNRENGKFSPWNIYDEYTPREESYNPYEEVDSSWMDEWIQKFSEWQADNRAKRDAEEAEFEIWFTNLKESFSTTIGNIKDYWSQKFSEITTIVQEKLNIARETIGEILDTISQTFQNAWNFIKENAIAIWTAIQEWFSEFWTNFTEYWMQVWSDITTFLSETWTFIQETARTIWEAIKQFFIDTWTNIQQTAITIWESVKTFFQTTWQNIQTIATTIWNAIKQFFTTTWNAIKTAATTIWEAIKKFFIDTWNAIKQKATEIWNKVKDVFEEKFDLIKEKAEELMEKFDDFRDKVKEVFENVMHKIQDTISPVIDKIKNFIDVIKDAIQAVKDFFASGIEKISGAIGSVFGGGGGGSARAAVASYSAAPMSERIPALADGAVIRGGNPFLALLGDQPAGQTNVETPLATIEQAVRNVVGQRDTAATPLTININYDGETFARLSLNDILSEAARQGYDVDLLGWQG